VYCVGDTDQSGQNWNNILCWGNTSMTWWQHFQLSSTGSMGKSHPSMISICGPTIAASMAIDLPFPQPPININCRLPPNVSPRSCQQSTPPAPLLGLSDSPFQLSATHIIVDAAFHNTSALSFLQCPMASYCGGTPWACSCSRHSRTFASQPGWENWCCTGGSPSCVDATTILPLSRARLTLESEILNKL
jgi:hypothetical protein